MSEKRDYQKELQEVKEIIKALKDLITPELQSLLVEKMRRAIDKGGEDDAPMSTAFGIIDCCNENLKPVNG